MLPFERLRYLARYSGDDRTLVEETAECLADFGDDIPRARRVVPSTARASSRERPAVVALLAGRRRRELRRPRARALRVIEKAPHRRPARVGAAVPARRADRHAGLARDDRRRAGRTARPRHRGRAQLRVEWAIAAPTGRSAWSTRPRPWRWAVRICWWRSSSTSPTTALVPAGTADLRWSLGDAELWLVVPVDRLLPDRMLGVVQEHVGEDAGEWMPVADVTKVAGPGGLDPPSASRTAVDCPVAPELLRL